MAICGSFSSRRVCSLAASLMMLAAVASAAPVTVVNPGFEDLSGETVFNEFTFGPLTGWGLYDPAGITNGGAGNTYFIGTLTPFEPDPVGAPGVFANIPAGAPEGARVGIAFNFANSGGQGEYGFQQTLAATLAANTRYTLDVDIINIASATSRSGQFFNLSGFPGYRVDLMAGGVVLAQDLNSLAGSLSDGQVGTSTLVFTSDAAPAALGMPLAIRLVNLNVVDAADPSAFAGLVLRRRRVVL
jgi:hapalindole H/12-epi-hapalindole U/12-epi-fischerindole U synthase